MVKLYRSQIYDNLGFTEDPNKFDGNDMIRTMVSFEKEIFNHNTFILTDNKLALYGKDTPILGDKLVVTKETNTTNTEAIQINPYGFNDPGNAPDGCRYIAMFWASNAMPLIHVQVSDWKLYCNAATNIKSYFFTPSDDDLGGGGGSGGAGAGGDNGGGGSNGDPADSNYVPPPPPPPPIPCNNSNALIGSITIVEPCDITGDDGLELGDEDNNKTIRDSLDGYPCAQEALKRMKDVNTYTQNILSSVFGVNQNVNITFLPMPKDSFNSSSTVGEFKRGTFNSLGKFEATIYLNTLYLNTASQELLSIVSYHESVHAFLNYLISKWANGTYTSQQFQSDYPQIWNYINRGGSFSDHNYMSTEVINNFKKVLKSAYPNLPDSTNSALCWGGLFKTWSFDSLFNADLKQRIFHIVKTAANSSSQSMSNMGLNKCK